MSFLPPEIWELVFYQVQLQNKETSFTDLTNCSRACVTFQNILQPTQCIWQLQGILPMVIRKLDRDSVLALREVCKSWKVAVDHFLENYNNYFDKLDQCRHENAIGLQRNVREKGDPLGDLAWLTSFESTEQYEEFFEQDNMEGINPFPGGSLSLEFSTIWGSVPLNRQECWRSWPLAQELLLSFGHHVTHLKMQFFHNFPISLDLLSQILACLHFTPNLKTFYLRLHVFWETDELRRGNIAEIADQLPPLPHLESLEFSHNLKRWSHGIPSFWQNRLASHYLAQLSRLQMSLCDSNCRSYLQSPHPNENPVAVLQNLKELELHVSSQVQLTILESLALASAPLEKVTLLLKINLAGSHSSSYRGKISQVLKLLVPLAGSLQSLTLIYLSWEDYRIHDSRDEFQLVTKLHSLKTLQLYGFEFYLNQEIFSSLPLSLEYLHLHLPSTYRRNMDLPKELDGPLENIYSKAIWCKFRKLKCISVRDMYGNHRLDEERREAESFSQSKMYWRSTFDWRQEKGDTGSNQRALEGEEHEQAFEENLQLQNLCLEHLRQRRPVLEQEEPKVKEEQLGNSGLELPNQRPHFQFYGRERNTIKCCVVV